MLQSVTLECSLKPFKVLEEGYVRDVCRKIFTQWKPLCETASTVSLLTWVGDGSEILDYKGDLNEEFEWGRYAGGCNRKVMTWYPARDPNREGIHTRSYLYCENPPVYTYGKLKWVISLMKEVGREIFGEEKTIRIGATFDPGPEFANSTFKYDRHREICMSSTMGISNFVCAYATLHADNTHYAGFPDGIPEGLPFGTFLGRQSNIFLTDMGYDYIWFSNGLGFGRDTWSTTGAVFDGETFNYEEVESVRRDVFDFWQLFRAECPDFPVETRGTNMSVGIDYAKDGVPLYDMYKGGFNFLPPPNSPWAALDGDFGLELMGYLTRIAELPDDKQYLFRYYVHDPWWMNSPWYDRYQGQPHDIYMPLSCARIDREGKIGRPTHLNLLTIDNTLGDLPDNCAQEPQPHLLRGLKEMPDKVAPVVWVYPFKDYCTSLNPDEMNRMFSGDWFVRGAINHGFPLTMVVSADHFAGHDKKIYQNSVIFAPVPTANTAYERTILDYIQKGGKVMLYGPLTTASEAVKQAIGVSVSSEKVKGDMDLTIGNQTYRMHHDTITCAGDIDTIAEQGAVVLAHIGHYAIATKKGNVGWLRGILSSDYVEGQRLLVPCDERVYYPTETLATQLLAEFGWQLSYEKDASQRSPIVLYSYYDNALMLSAYHPSTTVKTTLKTPLGAPVFLGYETKLEQGSATYHFPKAEHKECRFFVLQEEGILSAKELPPVSFIMRRRIGLYGLKNATVRVFGEAYCEKNMTFTLNGVIDEYTVSDPIEGEYITDEHGTYFEARNVTGSLVVSMPRPAYKPQPLSYLDSLSVRVDEGEPNYL